jgi:hypothetical protein
MLLQNVPKVGILVTFKYTLDLKAMADFGKGKILMSIP